MDEFAIFITMDRNHIHCDFCAHDDNMIRFIDFENSQFTDVLQEWLDLLHNDYCAGLDFNESLKC